MTLTYKTVSLCTGVHGLDNRILASHGLEATASSTLAIRCGLATFGRSGCVDLVNALNINEVRERVPRRSVVMVAAAKHFVTVRSDWPKSDVIPFGSAIARAMTLLNIKTTAGGASFKKQYRQANWSRSVERIVFEDLGL